MRSSGERGVNEGGEAASAAGRVSIVLNGERRVVGSGLSVAGLLRKLGLQPGMVVVERNRAILARDTLGTVPVDDGDRFELVHFVGGG